MRVFPVWNPIKARPHLWSEDPVLQNLSVHHPKASGESPFSSIKVANIPKDGWVKKEKPAFQRAGVWKALGSLRKGPRVEGTRAQSREFPSQLAANMS